MGTVKVDALVYFYDSEIARHSVSIETLVDSKITIDSLFFLLEERAESEVIGWDADLQIDVIERYHISFVRVTS